MKPYHVHLLRMTRGGMPRHVLEATYQEILEQIVEHERAVEFCREALGLLSEEVERRNLEGRT